MTALGRTAATCLMALASTGTASAQEMPPDYASVLKALGRTGDFKDGVLKVNIPRTDLTRDDRRACRRRRRSASAGGSR